MLYFYHITSTLVFRCTRQNQRVYYLLLSHSQNCHGFGIQFQNRCDVIRKFSEFTFNSASRKRNEVLLGCNNPPSLHGCTTEQCVSYSHTILLYYICYDKEQCNERAFTICYYVEHERYVSVSSSFHMCE